MNSLIDAGYERLITSGSDNRLLPGAGGLNPYGCSPVPRPAIPFGNCTCSSPSQRGMEAAMGVLQRLQGAGSAAAEEQARRICQEQRQQLAALLQLPEDVDIALAPSGTDVELLVLALAAGRHTRPIVNLIVGPTEVGSGTPHAAAGCHYDTLVPSGREVRKGDPISEELAARTTIQTVDIRNERGEMLAESEIDGLVTEMVAAHVDAGAQVVLHLVAHSKTGMHAPSLECVERISRHLGQDVTVVVDAAQGRVSRRGLREIFSAGHLVMFTGSKFYGGPPFSGALFVPSRWSPAHLGIESLPDGFDDYFTAGELPESWTSLREALPGRSNPGAILRWAAALAEIDAYYQVPNDVRLQILRSFEQRVPQLLADTPGLQMLPVFPPVRDDSQTRLLESKTTVFAFRVEVDGRLLGRDELKQLHRELNNDVAEAYPHLPAVVMSRGFHLGQPVSFADGSAALRIALGGEMIVRVATDRRLGDDLQSRINWLCDQLQYLKTKLAFLALERSKSEQERSGAGNPGTERTTPEQQSPAMPAEPSARRFHDRIGRAEVVRIWQAIDQCGFLDDNPRSLLVHDLGRMRRRIGMIQQAFGEPSLHALAIKANPLVSVLREAVETGAGLEAASLEEIHLALAAGCPPERIVFDSPAKTADEIDFALRTGVLINADNFDELHRIDEIGEGLDSSSRLGLRINPQVGAGAISHTSVAGADSRFGVPIAEQEAIVRAFRQHDWLTGLHCHVGSQGCRLEMLVEAAQKIERLSRTIQSATGRPLEFIDVGGGLPAIYAESDTAVTPHSYASALRESAAGLFDPQTTLVTEFGRAVQAGCGLAFSRVESVRPERSLAVIHLGADFLLRPVYRPQEWSHEFFVLSAEGQLKDGPHTPLTIGGPLCFSGDVVARNVPLPPVNVGDWIVIRDTGAYTLSLWSRHCNRGIPAVIGCDDESDNPIRLLRKAESPEDVVRFWEREPMASFV